MEDEVLHDIVLCVYLVFNTTLVLARLLYFAAPRKLLGGKERDILYGGCSDYSDSVACGDVIYDQILIFGFTHFP